MKIAEVQFNMWDKAANCPIAEDDLKLGDNVIINVDSNSELGKVIGFREVDENAINLMKEANDLHAIIKKATLTDLDKKQEAGKKTSDALDVCRKLIEKNQLQMKLVDVHFSLDEKKIIFAFIADGRVDFRQLAKDLIRHFQKNVRLQQLGVRDEAKINGDLGSCGQALCCKTHLRVLGNVNAEQAEAQQISHRGAERLSGICNRLKCCLRYENDLYVELSAKFPPMGSVVKTSRGKGQIIEWHIIKQTVNVKLEDGETIAEIPLTELN
ncbi:MAG: regulatory iron-sulfur-containing complex subunit RicT [Patescibacteria group bacterium]|nr:regulatory iron-sulfur-containing complex subunit RicT [Patescibacteria group bacterium]